MFLIKLREIGDVESLPFKASLRKHRIFYLASSLKQPDPNRTDFQMQRTAALLDALNTYGQVLTLRTWDYIRSLDKKELIVGRWVLKGMHVTKCLSII